MVMRNYRQAKRGREDARKKRQQEKLERKRRRVTDTEGAAVPAPDAPPSTPEETP